MKRSTIIIILACALPLRELHKFFSIKVIPGLYPLAPKRMESPAWYVHDIVAKSFIAIAFWLWVSRETKKDREFATYLGVIALFFTLDFILYLLNHSSAGLWYFALVYVPVLCYAIRLIKKTTRG